MERPHRVPYASRYRRDSKAARIRSAYSRYMVGSGTLASRKTAFANRSFEGALVAAGPGFEPGLSDSESKNILPAEYRRVHVNGIVMPISL